MPNPVNKVILNGVVLVDLSEDTAIREDVNSSKTFHLPTGALSEGDGTLVHSEKRISENGTYISYSDGVSGYTKVIVEVTEPPALTEEIVITPTRTEQTITPINAEAFSQVTVEAIPDNYTELIAGDGGKQTIENNGVYNVKNLREVTVDMGATKAEIYNFAQLIGI